MDNYCSEHETVWFKKGSMRGYAHPLEGGGWCNRPKDYEPPLVDTTTTPPEMLKIEPQERGMWMKEVGEFIRRGELTKDSIMGEKNPLAIKLWNVYWVGMKIGLSIKVEK